MSRLIFAFLLSALMCSTSFAQDSRTKKKTKKRGEARSRQQGKERGREKPRQARTGTQESRKASPVGTWRLAVESKSRPERDHLYTLRVSREGDKLVIVHVRSRSREAKATSVKLEGTRLSFTVATSSNNMFYQGRITEDLIRGTMEYRSPDQPSKPSRSSRAFVGTRDTRLAFRKRIGELVEKGKLTREEAGQLYSIAFPERSRDRDAGRETDRRYRNRRTVEVKDPAQFKIAGGKALFSGPQPSEKIPSFKVTGLNGERVGKVFDPVRLAGGKLQVLIFMDDNGVGIRGLFGTASILSQIADKSGKQIQLTAILLGDDPAKLSQFGKRFGERLSGVVMAASQEGRDGPGVLGLNRTISMTIVVAKDGEVTHNLVFPQSMLYPNPYFLGAIASVIGQKRETVTKWLNVEPADSAPARGRRTPARRPSREELRNLVRPSREELLKRFDKDGDGKLSEEEGRAARKALQPK